MPTPFEPIRGGQIRASELRRLAAAADQAARFLPSSSFSRSSAGDTFGQDPVLPISLSGSMQFVRMTADQVPESSSEYVAGVNAVVQTRSGSVWTDSTVTLEATCPDELPLRNGDYFWVVLQPDSLKWVPTTIPRNAPIIVIATAADSLGMLSGYLREWDNSNQQFSFVYPVKVVDQNNPPRPGLPLGAYHGADLIGHVNGYQVYGATCCAGSGGVIVPPPPFPPPPVPPVPPPPPPGTYCPIICNLCTAAPYYLTVTLAGFSGGGDLPPATGGCPNCTTNPNFFDVDLTGFSGSLINLEGGPVQLPLGIYDNCSWMIRGPFGDTLLTIGGGIVRLDLSNSDLEIGNPAAYATYTGAVTGSDCCSPIVLTYSSSSGSAGEYPATLTVTPTCAPDPAATTGCEQANIGAITLGSIGNCSYGYSDGIVTGTATYDGATWHFTGGTQGGCDWIYAGSGDCALTGGVILTRLTATGTAPATLTLAALSAVDNCPGNPTVPPPPPPPPGTVDVPCCTPLLLPARLYAVFDAPDCPLIDGLVVTIDWDGSTFWIGTLDVDLSLGSTLSVNLQCAGTDCNGFILNWQFASLCAVYTGGPDAGCVCDPILLTFTGESINNNCGCTAAPSAIVVRVIA